MIRIKKKNRYILQAEERLGEEIEDVMYRLYVLEDKGIDEVAKIMGIPRKTLVDWKKRAHIFSHQLKSLK